MGKISSLPDAVRQEIIGYLAQPGIIANITAEVPVSKCADFEAKYGVTPYPIYSDKKFGDQFRIYLTDPDGCPDVLKEALDKNYSRLNDTVFIRELVDKYGFSFFKSTQDVHAIQAKAKSQGSAGYQSFLKGFNSSKDFLSALQSSIAGTSQKSPDIQLITSAEKTKGKKPQKSKKISLLGDSNAGLSEEQLTRLGWLGEQYFYNMLCQNSGNVLSSLGIPTDDHCTITWFNNGFVSATSWSDLSVGKGCDIIIQTATRSIFVEVKTSRRKSPIFAMTSFEMQMMQQKRNDFYLVKIDNVEHLIAGDAPNVRIFSSPFEYFFVPSRMYSAIFYCN